MATSCHVLHWARTLTWKTTPIYSRDICVEHAHLNKWHSSIPAGGQKVNCVFRDGWSHVTTYASLTSRPVLWKQNCTILSLHRFNEIRVLLPLGIWGCCLTFLRSCSTLVWGSVSMTPVHSMVFILIQVHPSSLLLLSHHYSTKSRNNTSHTWVSSYWYHVNMV